MSKIISEKKFSDFCMGSAATEVKLDFLDVTNIDTRYEPVIVESVIIYDMIYIIS
jgi:hypothetical protein